MQPVSLDGKSSRSPVTKYSSHLVELLLICCLAMVMGLHIFTSTFTRLIADDYCTSAFGLRDGLIGGLVLQYNSWAGQFSNILVKNFAGIAGIQFVQVLPLIILLSWLLVSIWAFRQVFLLLRVGGTSIHLLSFCAGLIFIVNLVMLHPYPVQSFYWMAAVVPYVSPLVLFTLWIGWVARYMAEKPSGRRRITYYIVLTSGLSFIAAGFSETFLVVQTSALVLFLFALYLYFPRSMQQSVLKLIIFNLAAILTAAIIIITAPGNSVRMSQFSAPPDAGNLVWSTIIYGISFVFAALFVFAPATTASFAALSIWLGYRLRPNLSRPTRYTPLVWLIAAFGISVPFVAVGLVFVNTLPPARTYIIPLFFLSILIMSLGIWIGAILYRSSRRFGSRHQLVITSLSVLLVVITFVSVIGDSSDFAQVLPAFQSFASEWDQRDQFVRESADQGVRNVQLASPEHDVSARIGVVTISSSPDFWINQCAARYYGIDTIAVRDVD